TANSCSIRAEIVSAKARRRPHIDTGALADRAYSDHDVITEPHDRSARYRLDHAIAARQRWRATVSYEPFPFGYKPERGVLPDFGRHPEFKRRNIGIGGTLERGHCRSWIIGAPSKPEAGPHL